MNLAPERILSSYDEMVDMGMKALVEEAAADSGGSVGAGKDWVHGEIRQCAWWLVALATLLLLDSKARTKGESGAKRDERGTSISHTTRAHAAATARHHALPSQHRLPVP